MIAMQWTTVMVYLGAQALLWVDHEHLTNQILRLRRHSVKVWLDEFEVAVKNLEIGAGQWTSWLADIKVVMLFKVEVLLTLRISST